MTLLIKVLVDDHGKAQIKSIKSYTKGTTSFQWLYWYLLFNHVLGCHRVLLDWELTVIYIVMWLFWYIFCDSLPTMALYMVQYLHFMLLQISRNNLSSYFFFQIFHFNHSKCLFVILNLAKKDHLIKEWQGRTFHWASKLQCPRNLQFKLI